MKKIITVALVGLVLVVLVLSAVLVPKLIDRRDIFDVNGKYGLKDRSGKIIIEPIYDEMQKTPYDLIMVIKNKKLGLADKNGVFLVAPKYDADFLEYDFEFSDGLAAVIKKTKDGINNCVYIDKTGKEVLDPNKFNSSTVQDESYGACSQFSEGLAPATYNWRRDKTNGGYMFDYGYIDKQGNIVVKVKDIDQSLCGDALCISNFKHGIAKIAVEGKWKYINKKGKFIHKKAD